MIPIIWVCRQWGCLDRQGYRRKARRHTWQGASGICAGMHAVARRRMKDRMPLKIG